MKLRDSKWIKGVVIGLVFLVVAALAVQFGDLLGVRMIRRGSPRLTLYQGESITLEIPASTQVQKLEICDDEVQFILFGYRDFKRCSALVYFVKPGSTQVSARIPRNYEGRAVVIVRQRGADNQLLPIAPRNAKIALWVSKAAPQAVIEESGGESSGGGGGSGGGSSNGGGSFNAQSSPPPEYDVILKNDESADRNYGPVANDLERGDLLRQAVSEMASGDTLLLGEGRFDLDCKTRGNLRFPDNIAVVGQGMDETHLFSNCWSDDQGSAFEVRNGTFSDLAFENQSWDIFEDGRTIQMYDGLARTPDNLHYLLDTNNQKIRVEANPGPFTATFDRVKLIGNAWVVYEWSTRGHSWIIRDSVIVSGRQGISMMAGGGNFQNATILRTIFDIDTMRSQDIGWTSKGQPPVGGGYGVVARGGHVTVEDSEFHMKCGGSPHPASYVPRCVGIFDGNDFSSNSSSLNWITLLNNRWFIDGDFYGSGSPDTYDIFMTNEGAKEKLQLTGGCGSGPDCVITKNWP